MIGAVMINNDNTGLSQEEFTTVNSEAFPSKKSENWKYFPLRNMVKEVIKNLSVEQIALDSVVFSGNTGFVHVNRSFDAHDRFKQNHENDEFFIPNLNCSLNKDCFTIDIPENYNSEGGYLDIGYGGNDECKMASPLIFVNCRKNSNFVIYEKYNFPRKSNMNAHWLLPVMVVLLEENASLEIVKIHNSDNHDLITTSYIFAEVLQNARFSSKIINGEQSKGLRNQYVIDLKQSNASATIKGLSLQKRTQISEANVRINHISPDCYSEQEMKYVLADSSKGIFQGTIHVDRQAQKTDAHQLCNTIILGDAAEMNTKPELEIYADDVKCSHGATGGYIDREQIFYLRSRGFTEEQAKQIIIESFANEIIDSIKSEEHRIYAREALSRYFNVS